MALATPLLVNFAKVFRNPSSALVERFNKPISSFRFTIRELIISVSKLPFWISTAAPVNLLRCREIANLVKKRITITEMKKTASVRYILFFLVRYTASRTVSRGTVVMTTMSPMESFS